MGCDLFYLNIYNRIIDNKFDGFEFLHGVDLYDVYTSWRIVKIIIELNNMEKSYDTILTQHKMNE